MDALVLQYGWEVIVVALVAILLVGVVKAAFKEPLEKISKDARKAVYEISSMVFVAAGGAVMVAIKKGEGKEYWYAILSSYGAMKVMYPLYENLGMRELLRLIVSLVKGNLVDASNTEDNATESEDDATISRVSGAKVEVSGDDGEKKDD